MIEFTKANQNLSLLLLLSILFFLRKGIQYAAIENFIPLSILVGLIVLLAATIQSRKTSFILIVRIWAIVLIIWSAARIIFSIVHLTVQPFDGSFHLAHQFSGYALILSILMSGLGISMFRSSNKKRIVDWL